MLAHSSLVTRKAESTARHRRRFGHEYDRRELMRVAWFSPLPPIPSGIATYSAELLQHLDALDGHWSIDRFADRSRVGQSGPRVLDAHEFIWTAHRQPYDLVVYQLGNSPWHDYMWAYLVRYPGLVVLHDARLHHARARQLLAARRLDDYRREFQYDHPQAPRDAAEYAVDGLAGAINYFWSMLRVVVRTARLVVVHNRRVAEGLGEEYPGIGIEAIRMGVTGPALDPRARADRRARVRRELNLPDDAIVFVAFGHVTAEKRIEQTLAALATLARRGVNAHLVLVGEAQGYPALEDRIGWHGLRDRVRAVGYVADGRVGDYFAAADSCLCLRWPTTGETSASWLRALAAGTPTVITALANLADVPTLEALSGRRSHASRDPVALSVDLLDEHEAIVAAMSRLAGDPNLRDAIGRAGRAYWAGEHAIELMAEDYERVMREAAGRPAPHVDDLPRHLTDDYSSLASRLSEELGVPFPFARSHS